MTCVFSQGDWAVLFLLFPQVRSFPARRNLSFPHLSPSQPLDSLPEERKSEQTHNICYPQLDLLPSECCFRFLPTLQEGVRARRLGKMQEVGKFDQNFSRILFFSPNSSCCTFLIPRFLFAPLSRHPSSEKRQKGRQSVNCFFILL